MPTCTDVVRIGTNLPEVEESTWRGAPALKVAARLVKARDARRA